MNQEAPANDRQPGSAAGPQLVAAIGAELDTLLAAADTDLAQRYPGGDGARQPVHTVYVPAQTLGDAETADPAAEWGAAAWELLEQHGGDTGRLAEVVGLEPQMLDQVLEPVRRKLLEEPVEDLRIDFEDGYGVRGDPTEDGDTAKAARILRRLAGSPSGPFSYGVRVKCLEAPLRARSLRTLTTLLATLSSDGALPPGLVTTLPKVTSVDQVSAFVTALTRLESGLDLPAESLKFEIQVETPQAILNADGTATVARMVHAAAGRCTGLHYGTYDYSAGIGIPASQQRLDHPAADHAKQVMQLAAAGTGVRLSDGSTNVMPVGDRDQVHAAWRLHSSLVRRALDRGYYQGWDMHPGHLVTRYLATYAFFREALPSAARRLRIYLDGADSGIVDEPATAQALSSAILRGVDCGAISADEATGEVGSDLATLAALARRPAPPASGA